MARSRARPNPTSGQTLEALKRRCPICGHAMWADYTNHRSITMLQGLVRLHLKIRRCANPSCERYRKPHRPEGEGAFALPGQEFGLDVISLVGSLRYAGHRSVPEIHRELAERGVVICERTVTNLLDRYDELVALCLADDRRVQRITMEQGQVVLAIDGLQPDVGHEILWVIRDCLSGEVLLARSLLSSTEKDIAALLRQVKRALPVPVIGVISDGQRSIRKAVGAVFPGVPYQLCQFHYLREAARPIYEADRHAKKELKKGVRGVRPIERAVEGRSDAEAEIVRGYCAAVRSSITDDGRPPLAASGLKLHGRITAIAESLERVGQKGGFPKSSNG
jgi:hypothetical protein